MRERLNIPHVTPKLLNYLTALLVLSFVIGPLASASVSAGQDARAMLRAEPDQRTTPTATPIPTPVPTPSPYDISPSGAVQGKEYEALVTSNQCLEDPSKNSIKDFQLYAPVGSGIRVTDSKATDCRVTAKVSIAADAPVGIVKLQLIDKDRVPRVIIDFAVTGITAGPIPPGLNNKGEVDVMWSVLPDKITSDNFGGKVKRQFYCVEVIIGNDSGFDLQLASIGFTLPGLANSKQRIPSSGYRIVRGSLEEFQLLAPRNFVVNGLKMLGPILTGFLPFFHAASHATNFSEAINVISNPLEKGVENLWPDLTPRELDRLADMTFRDDISTKTIVPNNVQVRILTFVPRELVFPYKKKALSLTGKELRPDNPQEVMQALGNVVIVGEQIEHVNRIRVVSTGLETPLVDRSISGKITDVCNSGVGGVTMTLSGGSNFTSRSITTAPDGTYSFANTPIGRTYTVTPSMVNMTFHPESPGSETFTLNDTRTNLDFGADYAVLTISGKIVDKDSKPVKGITVALTPTDTLTPKELAQNQTTNDSGIFRFDLAGSKVKVPTASFEIKPKSDKHTFDRATQTWKCDKRTVDFVATPNATPSPTPKPTPAP
jgi:hypothetical protein